MHLTSSFVHGFQEEAPPWGFDGLGYFVYKRTYARRLDEHTTEEWWQTCQRVVNGLQDIGAGYTQAEMEQLYTAMFELKALPAGRMLWQLGSGTVERFGGDSLCNCWFTRVDTPEDLGFIFDELMLGGGVGFSVVDSQLPPITGWHAVRPRHEADAYLIVPDKREGWVQLLEETVRAYLGQRPAFDYSTQLIRPAGAPIKTFGGVASGPGVLQEGITKISRVLDAARGRQLNSVELLDIVNIIGSVVVSGNVRRSAQIALGSPKDRAFLRAKRWDLGDVPAWRAMSNNSVQVADLNEISDEFWEGYHGNGEPYGLFNLEASRRFGRMGEEMMDTSIEGVNPCAEVPLASWESCNLAEIFLPRVRDAAEFHQLAGLLYKGQKAVAALPYRQARTRDVVGSNRRLGLSVSGVAQASKQQLGWLTDGYRELRSLDREWSRQRRWPESVRLTTVKPSGTLSLLAGVTPGVHPGFSQYYTRRVRVSAADPLVQVAEGSGYPVEPVRQLDGTEDERTAVVSFPCRLPEGTTLSHQASAIDQLDTARWMQRVWADNAVSCTVYYQPDELAGIQRYLRRHWSEMKSISFLRQEDHGFDQAPMEPISRTVYDSIRGGLATVGSADLGDDILLDDCEGGACPVR